MKHIIRTAVIALAARLVAGTAGFLAGRSTAWTASEGNLCYGGLCTRTGLTMSPIHGVP